MDNTSTPPESDGHEVVDSVTQVAPLVLPLAGAAIMLLLAFIAVTMA